MGFALGSGATTLAVGDDLEDQTSFRMELQAVHLLLCALRDAVGSARARQTLHCRRFGSLLTASLSSWPSNGAKASITSYFWSVCARPVGNFRLLGYG